ncbi:MAG TPA: flagellar biosynthetic protein FliR [Acetobacteraceae bacterium]|nr:flagellar biosynthetic protein FliR [Acetobacteraceae bacterium]
MTGNDAVLLAALPGALPQALPLWAFGFVLVLGRVGAAVMLLPGLGEAEAPAIVRAGIALALTILLLPGLAPMIPAVPTGAGEAAAMVGAEVITGLWLGWLARLLVLALPLAGEVISYMLGISSVLQPDPELGAQTTALSRMFSLAAPVAVLASGLYALPVLALAGSYRLITPGSLLPSGAGTESAVHAVAVAFGLAVRLASPFVIVGIVWQVAAGLLARLIPRVQVYFLSLPGQILGGLVLLAVLTAALLTAWQQAVQSGFDALPGLH